MSSNVPDSNPGSCLDPELPGTGLELGAIGGGGRAETGSFLPGKKGDGREMEQRWRKHDRRLCHAGSRRDAAESEANNVRTL
jgi:hypothetical protein